jgi:UPF0755 protein
MLLVIFVVLALAAAIAFYFIRMDASHGPAQPVYVEIPRGSSSWSIGERLTQAGLLRHPAQYVLARLLLRGPGSKAGEYEFRHGMTPAEIYGKISRGDVYLVELRIPEGSDLFDLAELVAAAGFASRAEFLQTARSPRLTAELAPGAPSLEGYLFPSTYRFPRKTSPERICRTLVRQFYAVWKDVAKGEPVHPALTLASLVEKEAKLPAERPMIAGVFRNRLRKGMKLQCDPTVVYAALLEGRWRGVIYKSDLAHANPYNTYRHSGLPPGPIANPGRAAIEAALRPAETDALFFVAAPGATGAHIFSRDLQSHEQAVVEYRRGEQKSRSTGPAGRMDRKPPARPH